MRRPGGGPPSMPGMWADIIEEATALAEEYRQAGFEVAVLHPGDVVPVPDDEAFDVLLPGSEFDAVEALVESFDADEVEVFTATDAGFGYVVVVATDGDRRAAICCPLYYELTGIDEFVDAVTQAGAVELHLRPLSERPPVVLSIDDPSLVFG